jgi:hypothetical protein
MELPNPVLDVCQDKLAQSRRAHIVVVKGRAPFVLVTLADNLAIEVVQAVPTWTQMVIDDTSRMTPTPS